MSQDQDQQASNGQTTALTPYQQRMVALREDIGQDATPRAIIPRTFAEAQSFAAAIAQSALVPEALRNRAPDVLMIVLAGAELEIPPVRALSLFHVIEGVPKLSADGLAGKVQASPLCDYLEPIEQSDTRVTWRGRRKGRGELTISYTIADAERAGLTGPTRNGRPSNWMKHPTDMLNARCKARLCRLLWPDLCAGLTTAEEALDALNDAPPSSSAAFAAPGAPPAAAVANLGQAVAAATTSSPAAAAATSSGKGKGNKAAPSKPAVIDATATESTSSAGASANSAPSTARSDTSGSGNTSTASTNTTSTSSSSSSSPSDVTSTDATPTSSEAAPSSTSAPAEDESGFGDDESAPAAASTPTIEQFEAELAAVVKSRKADGLATVKAKWLPWSKDESPTGGKQHAHRMRSAFAKAQSDLGIK